MWCLPLARQPPPPANLPSNPPSNSLQARALIQQQQQQLYLFTNNKTPASYGTKWADLHPDSQKKILLQIEERILGYRDESQRLDQCSRLYDSSVSNDAFEHDASRILQELRGIGTSIDRQHKHLRNQKTLRKTDEQLRSILQGSKAEIAPTAAAARPPGGVGCLEKFPSSSSLPSLHQQMRLKSGRWMHTAMMTAIVKVERPAGVEELEN
ncbi:hypothetical protein ACFX13_040988 [Malus domestica]